MRPLGIVRKSFSSPTASTEDEKFDLARLQLKDLAHGVAYWLGTILVACAAVWMFGNKKDEVFGFGSKDHPSLRNRHFRYRLAINSNCQPGNCPIKEQDGE